MSLEKLQEFETFLLRYQDIKREQDVRVEDFKSAFHRLAGEFQQKRDEIYKLTIFGLAIGKKDFSRVIGETVAMGMDNDCTAAASGSIVGAIVGKAAIPQHWYQNFNNTIHSYLNGKPRFAISDVIERFTDQAMQIF